MREGIKIAKGRYVGYMDIDCEVSPEYIPDFMTALKRGYDVVYGIRKYGVNLGGLIRALASKLYSFLVRTALHIHTLDTESGYKFFERQIIMPVLAKTHDTGWFWDTEIMFRAEEAKLKIKGVPVQFLRRDDKTSTVRLFHDTLEYIKKVWVFRKEIY